MKKEKLQYPLFDEETGKVICQICGKKFLVISPRHLIAKHKVHHGEYTKRYPDAPLSSKEFGVKSKYGRNKDLFTPNPNDEFEEIIVNENPDIEDNIDIDKILKSKSIIDPIKKSKVQILYALKTYFSNIRQDYLIEEYGPMSGKLKYHFITDFADPILKIIVQCPNTFWHNRDVHMDPLKNTKLRECGWKIIKIGSKAPTTKDITNTMDQI